MDQIVEERRPLFRRRENRTQEPDENVGTGQFVQKLRRIDIGTYATIKTVAYGLFDFTVLTFNFFQLKHLLEDGHEYYEVMFKLVITSIALQVLHAFLIVILPIIYNLKQLEDERRSIIINSVLVGIAAITIFVNVPLVTFLWKVEPPHNTATFD